MLGLKVEKNAFITPVLSVSDKMDIIVKFCGKEYHIEDMADGETIAGLKARIFRDTRVKPEHQRLMGIKTQQGTYLNESHPPIPCLILFWNLCTKQFLNWRRENNRF